MTAVDKQISKLKQEKKMLEDSIAHSQERIEMLDLQLSALAAHATPTPESETATPATPAKE